MPNFKILRTIKTEFGGVEVTKLKSSKTGLSVVLVDVEAPLVNGYFTVVTEAVDDNGCPHTLEHLVFLGSELYPYKGVLDSLANRALARGTNAWTAVDHTCYTITTAGSEGFLNLLPIFVDHILYPTLTESGHYTEVHHINGKGENAGVVYSEMQGRQNSSDSCVMLRYQRLMYPEGCGYRSETGGLMEALRKLDVETIRKYHSDYYRPDNLCLIISGKVDLNVLLKVLEPLDERIAAKGSLPSHMRPFVDSPPVPPLEKSIQEFVEFPDEDESMGQVLIAWFGPYINEYLDLRALEILHEYLSDSAVSVLQKEFVEIEDPLCTGIDISINEQTRTAILATFENVPAEDLEDLTNELFEVFERIVKEDGIDMERMKIVILRDRLKTLNEIENSPHSIYSEACIIDHIYGDVNCQDLERAVKDLRYYDEILNFSEERWIEYLKKFHVDQPHIAILGHPSSEFAKKLYADEKQRIEKQREELGSKKLEELDEKLKEAKLLNDVPVPHDIIDGFPVPSVETIPFINVITGRNKSDGRFNNVVQEYLDSDVPSKDLPYFIQYDHVDSSFIMLTIYVTTTTIPVELRPYLEIYLESFFSLPLNIETEGGGRKQLTYEEVVSELNKDTVSYAYSLGLEGSFEEMICISIKVEASKYQRGIRWLHDLLWNTEFTAERLKICATKLFNDIPQAKRDGYGMSSTVLQTINYDPLKSNKYALSVLNQEKILPNVIELLDDDPVKVIEEFCRFRNILTSPENLRIHVIGDILKINQPKSSWINSFKIVPSISNLSPVPLAQNVLTECGRQPGNKGYVVELPAIESTFAIFAAKGPTTYDSPDLAPLLVLCELLHTMEGIFWRLIRGQGLAYSVGLRVGVESGHVYLTIYRSPDSYKAYDQARQAIRDLSERKIEFDKSGLDGAKCGVIYGLVKNESSKQKAARESFILQVLKDLDSTYNRKLISKVQDVKMEDLYEMLSKYIINLFLPETSNVVVVSALGKVEDVREGFNSHGFKLEVKNLGNIISK